jgi:LuxR family maltose regulon positive regulatory protein
MRTARNRDLAQIVGTALHSAKFHPPRSASALIARPPLIGRIENGGKLVLLIAPPGSGKSTLLSQWCGRVDSRRRVAWLLCERRDRDPVHFFACLAATVNQAVAPLDVASFGPVSARTQCSAGHIADALSDQLSVLDRELTIVIDDLQFLDCAKSERVLLSLVLQSSPHVRWIIATRQVPRFDLQRLRLDDQLTSLGSEELGFHPEQVCELSLLLHGTELSLAAATQCCQRSEGWIAGVKLSLLDEHEAQGGLNHDIAAYLAAVAWQELPATLREFLLASCIADRLCDEQCNALTGHGDAAALLEEVERLQLFIQPMDGKHRWFRYHALYREFLRDQLRRLAPDRIASLHRAVSHWFAEQELPAEALHHAFATEDRNWCVQLVARCVPVWLRTGEFAEVLQWTARLTMDEIVGCTAIRDAHLMSLIFSRQFDRARADLRIAAVSAQDKQAARTLPALQLMMAIMTEAGVHVTMQQIDALSIAGDAYLSANLFNVAAYQLLVDKKFDAARRLALRGRELLQGTQHVYAAAQSAIVLILVDRAEGHAREAAESCMELYTRMRGGRRTPMWVTATTAAASVHYHHNRLQQAEALCSEVLPLLAMAPSLENLTVAHVVAARLKCAAGKYGDALRLLDYLHSVLESSNCQRLLARVCFEKVRIWLLQEQPLRALAVLADCGQSFRLDGAGEPAGCGDEPWEDFALSRVAIHIHRGAFDAAASLLQQLCEHAEVAGDVYGRVRLEAALATCRWHARDEESAFRWVNHALTLTENRGFSRAVFDDVFGLPEVFATAIKLSRVSKLPSAEYFKKFRDVLACDPYDDVTLAVSAMSHPLLTQRELDLLKLVSLGLSNRDISERSHITLLTTKWHLKNVFAKLGVSTRMEAVFRAQELKLVEGRPPFVSVR